MKLSPIFVREEVIKSIRKFFEEKEFHEVIVPVFNKALPLEPTLYSFHTQWKTSNSTKELYLTISPESGLKKMLAQGIGNCFSIGKCFRNLEGNGPRHNPEFLMLEWYRDDADYSQIMTDTEELVRFVANSIKQKFKDPLKYKGKKLHLDLPWERFSLEDLFHKHVDISMKDVVDDRYLANVMESRGYTVGNATWEQLFDQIFLNEIEPHLPQTPFFLVDFPARLSPLCTVNPKKPYLSERFEGYVGGMEIGNGNNENTDAQAVLSRFQQENTDRKERGEATHPIDMSFINALEEMAKKETKFAGIGLGVDRLAMIMADATDIAQVEPFCVGEN